MKRKCAILLIVAPLMTLAGCDPREELQSDIIARVSTGGVLICAEGHVFISSNGIVQVWENGTNGPRPMECTQEVK